MLARCTMNTSRNTFDSKANHTSKSQGNFTEMIEYLPKSEDGYPLCFSDDHQQSKSYCVESQDANEHLPHVQFEKS